jgi:hypothetical protein
MIFWLHLATGLIAGSIVLVMSVTGVLLMYEQQILRWADRDLRLAPPAPGAARLSVERLLGEAAAARPGARPSSLTMQADPFRHIGNGFGRVQPGDGARRRAHGRGRGLRWDHFNIEYKSRAVDGVVTPFERTDEMLTWRAAAGRSCRKREEQARR